MGQRKKKYTHKQLVKKAKTWLRNNSAGKRWSCSIVFDELVTANDEIPDVLGFSSGSSTLIEVKTSRADFLRGKKKKFRKYTHKGMGRYRFYFCPEGLIKPKDISHYWGLVYIKNDGSIELIRTPKRYKNINIEAEHRFLYSALRRNKKKLKL